MNSAGLRKLQVCGGDFLVSGDPLALLCTVLGSCIAACIYDPIAAIGGMNHYLLPHSGDDPSARYGDVALPSLIEDLCYAGANPRRLRAQIYGGARTMAGDSDIGEMNIDFARNFLNRSKVVLEGGDVGGSTARWIEFHAASGRASMRLIPTQRSAAANMLA